MRLRGIFLGILTVATLMLFHQLSSQAKLAEQIKIPDVQNIMADLLPNDPIKYDISELIEIVKKDRGQYDFRGRRSLDSSDPVLQLFIEDDPKYLEEYRSMLISGNRFLQAAALYYLGRLEDHESVDTIIGFLNVNDNVYIQRMAIKALGDLNANKAIPAMLDLQERLLAEERNGYRDTFTELGLAYALMDSKEATRALFSFIETSPSSVDRSFAIRNFKFKGHVDLIPEFIDLMDDVKYGDDIMYEIQEMTHHTIEGLYRDPVELNKLQSQWNTWWIENQESVIQKNEENIAKEQDIEPENSALGIGIELRERKHGNGVPYFQGSFRKTQKSVSKFMPLTIPIDDNAKHAWAHYVIFKEGKEIQRIELNGSQYSMRYNMIPFGTLAYGWLAPIHNISFPKNLTPGNYEIQVEARILCSQITYINIQRNSFGEGAVRNVGKLLDLHSNRLPFVITGNEPQMPKYQFKPEPEKTLDEWVAIATQEIGSEGWDWWESRAALERLDGQITAEHSQYTEALISELQGRLKNERDKHNLRGGESMWGAHKTAFMLGRIGDPRALEILEHASTLDIHNPNWWLSKSQVIMTRWYMETSLALVQVQQLSKKQRNSIIKRWIKHCFSSKEEHYMARYRLLPYLNELLGEERTAFYQELKGEIDDPWMLHDVQKIIDNDPK